MPLRDSSLVLRARHRIASRIQPPEADFASELNDWQRHVLASVKPYTMTSRERIIALTQAVEYVVERQIPGAFVECGVWRGGSVLAIILALQKAGVNDRDIYLCDTFDGMTKPGDVDVSDVHGSALEFWQGAADKGERVWPGWFDEEVFNLDLVKAVVEATGYPVDRLHFVQGDVMTTIPEMVPEQFALVRLDTDWYDSTRHEMIHLYPRLEQGGVLIIDDYGEWDGCRKAVDEYFAERGSPLLLSRIDRGCRMAVKN